ncbi:hypothetical protein FRC12_020335 [Ceratobasidium sp. 428]|nr:hypothetical protein FRC12_020335 [Ceratobasidium sp. 428]
MEFRGEDPRALSTPSDAVRYAKKIKLTPPEEYSDWDGEQPVEEGQGRAEPGTTDESPGDDQDFLRPPSTGRNYAADARNLMLAMRASRSFDGDSAASTAQQEEQEPDLSIESSGTDYRRRGADLMAQIRGEMSDEEGDGGSSVRDGSVSVRSGSVRSGSIIKSPQTSLMDLAAHLRSSREAMNQESIRQLSTSIRAMRLGDQDPSINPGPRRLPGRSSAEDYVPRDAATEVSGAGAGVNRVGLPQPPTIMISTAATPDPPRLQSRRRVSSETQRIQSQTSVPAPAHSHLEPQRPSTSPAHEDMNRFVSSSTVHTKSTTYSAESFVKHPGPAASVLSHSGSGVRRIAPTDLPTEALPDRIGKMVYDRAAMRWRQEMTDGNWSDGSEDPFKDFDSFLSTAGGDRSDDEGSAPMEEDDDQDQEQEHEETGEQMVHDDAPNFDATLEPIGLSVVEELPESGFDLDGETVGEQSTVTVGSPPNVKADITDIVASPQPSELISTAPLSILPIPKRRFPDLGIDTSAYDATTSRLPLRPALKSASSTPAPSAPPSRQSTVDPTTPMPDSTKNRRSVSFSDGRTTGKIRGLVARDESEGESLSDVGTLTITPPESDNSPSSRMKRIGNLLDELEDDIGRRND